MAVKEFLKSIYYCPTSNYYEKSSVLFFFLRHNVDSDGSSRIEDQLSHRARCELT